VERLGVLLLFLLVSFGVSAEPPVECDGTIKCVKLSWIEPTGRTDGTAITQIDRYDIHHTANNVFQGVYEVAAPSVEHYLVDVAAGNHTLTIRAVEGDVLGIMSSPATATILQAQIGPMTLIIQVL
jgi:hypothetical protein